MKTGKNKRRQQQGGVPVLVTFYVTRPKGQGAAAATATASAHHHPHGHGCRHRARCSSSSSSSSKPKDGNGRPCNRRADLLEHSRRLRALARQMATAAASPPPPHGRLRRDTDTDGAVLRGHDDGKPAGGKNRLSLARRPLERAASQQRIRQRCFSSGGDGWSWKRVLLLVVPFPCHSQNATTGRSRSRNDSDRQNNRKNKQKGWPAALLVGKLTTVRTKSNTVSSTHRGHSGLTKKLMSVFRQHSR